VIDGADLGPSLDRIQAWERRFAERAAQAKALADRTAELQASARRGDGLIEVTVGPNGQSPGRSPGLGWTKRPAGSRRRRPHGGFFQRGRLSALWFGRSKTLLPGRVGADSATGKAVLDGLSARLSVDAEEQMP
jgi:hypothetical protein